MSKQAHDFQSSFESHCASFIAAHRARLEKLVPERLAQHQEGLITVQELMNEVFEALERETAPARLDPDGTAEPLTRIAVHLRPQQAYHGAPHAVRDGIYENGSERISLR